ncbi:MAG: hypothetical protein WBV79_20275 [Rhodomicrobium sp.]
MKEEGSWETRIMPGLASFIEEQTSIFWDCLASSTAGGPKGFLGLVDDETVARFRSDNRQYIRQGILAENSKVYLFLIIDYGRPDASRSLARRSR